MKRFPAIFASLILALGPLGAQAAKPLASPTEPSVSPKVAERLKRLESQLSSVKSLKVNFVQEKEMAILEQKLVLKGHITLQQPDKLAWRVLSPVRYAMVIEGSTLKQWSEETAAIQQVSLAGNPVFTAAIKQIQNWFSGNYLALTREFNLEILSDSELVLQFTPRSNSPAREVIARMVMRFGADERFLKSMEIKEAGGDTMRILFSGAVINPNLSKEEWDPQRN